MLHTNNVVNNVFAGDSMNGKGGWISDNFKVEYGSTSMVLEIFNMEIQASRKMWLIIRNFMEILLVHFQNPSTITYVTSRKMIGPSLYDSCCACVLVF